MIDFRLVVVWMLKILMWGGIASLAWVVLSCEEFCEEPNRTAVVVNFYNQNNTALTYNNLKIRGVENDSLLDPNHYLAQKDFLQVLLPVNPAANLMSFSIKKDTLPADTIFIHYIRNAGFISPQCGCVTFAEIQDNTEWTENSISRVDMINPKVTTVNYRQGIINAENIKIYFY